MTAGKFAIVLGAVVGCVLTYTPPKTREVYALTTVVINVEDTITAKDFNGNIWEFPDEAGDWIEGDIASLLMDTEGTEYITDDKVLGAWYSGFIDGWEY